MKTRAAVFREVGKPLDLVEFPTPAPAAGETLVRVLASTLCGSDLHTYYGRRDAAKPTILGHEIIGEIVAFGGGAEAADCRQQPLQIGDRVSWAIVANCGGCFYCRRDLPQKCEQAVKFGHKAFRQQAGGVEGLVGGLADHCLLPRGASLMRLPDSLGVEVACPANCATATAAAALQTVGVVEHRVIVVFGLGLLGLMASAQAATRGAEVWGVDPDAARRELAEQFGATRTLNPEQLSQLATLPNDGRGFDAAIDMSGAPAAMEAALSSLRLGGTLVLVGAVHPTPAVELSPERVVRRNLAIHGVHNYRPQDLATAIDFLTANQTRFPLDRLVQQWFSLEQADDAFQAASVEPAPIRVGVREHLS